MKIHAVALLFLTAVFTNACAVEEQAAKPREPFSSAPRVLIISELNELEMPVRFSDKHIARWKDLNEKLKVDPDNKELQKEFAAESKYRESAGKSPVGLFLPKTEFRLDEPAPAYFILKNNSNQRLSLDMRLDLHFGKVCSNSCAVKMECVRVTDGYELQRRIESHTWRCGGPSLLTISESGFYCTGADLRTLGATVPGEYKMHWVGAGCKSQEVTFKILPPKRDDFAYKPITAARIFKLGDDPNARAMHEVARKIDEPLPPPVLDPAFLECLSFAPFAAGLSTGIDDRFYPDIFNLPSRDEFISAEADFEMPNGDKVPTRLVLTLIPRQHNKGLVLRETEHVYLIALSREQGLLRRAEEKTHEAEKLRMSIAHGHSLADPTNPLRFRFQLNDDWHETANLSGKIEICVLISTEEIKPQGRWRELQMIEEELRKLDETTEWKGLLCTPPISIHLPEMDSQKD